MCNPLNNVTVSKCIDSMHSVYPHPPHPPTPFAGVLDPLTNFSKGGGGAWQDLNF